MPYGAPSATWRQHVRCEGAAGAPLPYGISLSGLAVQAILPRGMESSRFRLKNCPFCKIAMVVVTADADPAAHARFECLTCKTTISFNDNSEWDAVDGQQSGKD